MIIKYFSWIKEHIGKSEEHVVLPNHITNVDQLINYEFTASMEEDLDKIDSEVISLIETSAEEAAAAPVPSPEEVTTDVYVSY